MGTQRFTNLADAVRAIKKDTRGRERRLRKARKGAAQFAKRYVIENTVPKAFKELADSIHVVAEPNGDLVIADAPHAGAVENGSRPHTPPLEPLIAWVKLRGMQGITSAGNVITNRTRGGRVKDRNLEAARVIATALSNAPTRTRGLGRIGAVVDVDAPTQIARAIQQAIKMRGTKPHKFMQKAIEPTVAKLHELAGVAVQDETGSGSSE